MFEICLKHVFQLRTEVQFYRAVSTKSSLKIKAFSPEVIKREQVIKMLDKPVILQPWSDNALKSPRIL